VGHDLWLPGTDLFRIERLAPLDLAQERVGRGRSLGAARHDDASTGLQGLCGLLKLGWHDEDLESLRQRLEREEAHPDPEPGLLHHALEPVEYREPRCWQLGLGVRAHDRADQEPLLAAGGLTTHGAVSTVGHQAARRRWEPMDDAQALDIATRAAFKGGRAALARLGTPGYLRWKGQRDVVVEASLDIQEQIVAVLQQECPGDAILAEEGPEDEPLSVDAARLWIVDPICGSLNFAQSIPFFAVSVALRVNGLLRVGVVYDPVRDEMFSARLGEAAHLNGRPITVLSVALGPEFWEQAWVACDIPHSGPRRKEALQAFPIISGEVLHHVILGSPALGLCYVAAGRVHAYWTLDAQPWDIAGAGVILSQAGGLMTDADGGSWLHSDGSYVAANAVSHKWALQTIKWLRDQNRDRSKA